ncbi:MAG: YceD family protein [Streptococcaceae bacterium]|nr:YceD family protein [Streptococcaceae bacterium]
MKWSIQEIIKKKNIAFNEKINLQEELNTRSKEILDSKDIHAEGTLAYDDGLFYLYYELSVVLTLPSSRSLEPVIYALEIPVHESFAKAEKIEESEELTDSDLILPLTEDWISLDDSLIDNILLNIPLQILSDDEKTQADLPSGKNWQVLSEDEFKASKKEEKKSPFADLADLLDDEK